MEEEKIEQIQQIENPIEENTNNTTAIEEKDNENKMEEEYIPQNDLNYLLEIISAQYFLIVAKWKEHFRVEVIKFYC